MLILELGKLLCFTQWNNRFKGIIDWFKNIKNKNKAQFTRLDIIDFYPSICKLLFDKVIEFVDSCVDIDPIDQACEKTLLFTKR